jgi:hypothetical protein
MSPVELLCFDLDDTLWAATPVLVRAGVAQYFDYRLSPVDTGCSKTGSAHVRGGAGARGSAPCG